MTWLLQHRSTPASGDAKSSSSADASNDGVPLSRVTSLVLLPRVMSLVLLPRDMSLVLLPRDMSLVLLPRVMSFVLLPRLTPPRALPPAGRTLSTLERRLEGPDGADCTECTD